MEPNVKKRWKAGSSLDPLPVDGDTLLSVVQVLAKTGNVTRMTLHRRMADPDPIKRFPEPDFYLSGRRYWRLGAVEEWLARQPKRQDVPVFGEAGKRGIAELQRRRAAAAEAEATT